MASTLPPLPIAPPPDVQRFTADGRPTTAQVIFETAMREYLKALAAAVGA